MESPIKNAFQCVNEIYRNCVRILTTADLLLEEKQFSRFNWEHVFKEPTESDYRSNCLYNLKQADSLLSGYLFHQYESAKYKKQLFTFSTVPWRIKTPELFTPVCCFTLFSNNLTPSWVYWAGAMPIWNEKNDFDGQIHEYNTSMALISIDSKKLIDETVVGKKVIGISVPLEKITSSNHIINLLINPLLESLK